MDKNEILKSLGKKSNGEIYLGVVGAVRTGKSTFIKKSILYLKRREFLVGEKEYGNTKEYGLGAVISIFRDKRNAHVIVLGYDSI